MVSCAPREANATSMPLQGDSCRSSMPCQENVPPAAAGALATIAHYPLGSWERHLMEERLRILKQHEREQLLREELDKECTFQPCVGMSQKLGNGTREQLEVLEQIPREQRRVPVFERLAQRAKEREERLAHLTEEKKRREEESLQHAFRPRVNDLADHRELLPSHVSNIPVEERLLHYGRSIERTRRLLQEQRRQQELEDIRQKTLLHRARSLVSKDQRQSDIADRSKRLLMEREAERALAQKALLDEHSFHPKVCTTSDAIDRGRCEAMKGIRDRGVALYEQGMRRKQQQQQQVDAARQRDKSRLHKPDTNPLTDEWIHHGQHRALFQQDFVRRQEVYQRVREEHQRNLASAIEENQRAMIPRVDQEMIERQVERLYLGAQEIRSETKKRMEKHITARECPFRPTLAPGTAYVIARANREQDVVKRLSMSASRNRRASLQNIFSSRNDGDDNDNNNDGDGEEEKRGRSTRVVRLEEAAALYYRQKRAVEEREMQLLEQKQRRAMEELCACTFRPQTSTSKCIQRRPSKKASLKEDEMTKGGKGEEEEEEGIGENLEARVSGVTAYLQRQAEAKRRRKEQEAKHESLGRGLPCNGPSCTIITPFILSSGRRPRIHSPSPRHTSFRARNETGNEALVEEEEEEVARQCLSRGGHMDPYANDDSIALAAHRWKLTASSARPRVS